MPATSPRFTITVGHAANDALKRLAVAQRRPVASIIREVLDNAAPAFMEIATCTERLEAARAAATAGAGLALSEVQAELQPHLDGILGHFQAIASIAEDRAAIDAQVDMFEEPDDEVRATGRATASGLH